MKLANNLFTFRDHTLDLSKKPLIEKLFEIFYTDPSEPQSLELLVNKIYTIAPYPKVSLRLWSSRKHSLTKLISRSRELAEQSFGAVTDPEWEWFPYDPKNKGWIFYTQTQDKQHPSQENCEAS